MASSPLRFSITPRKPSHFGSYCQSPSGSSVTSSASMGGNGRPLGGIGCSPRFAGAAGLGPAEPRIGRDAVAKKKGAHGGNTVSPVLGGEVSGWHLVGRLVRVGELDGVWDVRRTGGGLPPMLGVRKKISGASGTTKLGPLPGAPSAVDRLSLA